MSRQSLPIRALSILLLGILVNGAAFAEKPLAAKMKGLIHQLMRDSDDAVMVPGRAKFLKLSAGSPVKRTTLGVGEDGLSHNCEIVLDRETGKVTAAVLVAGKMTDEEHEEDYCFVLDPQGRVRNIAIARMLIKDGRSVRGSGTAEEVSVDAPGVQERLKNELDFWLKGKYRKKAGKPSAAPAAAQ